MLAYTTTPDGAVFREDGVQLGCGRDQLRDAYLALINAGPEPGVFDQAAKYYEDCRNGFVLAAIVDLLDG